MANKIEFTTKNARSFTTWLKKFSVLDNSLLLEVDLKNNIFIAKSYDEQRSAVKQSKIKFDEAGLLITSNKQVASRVKIGIYNILKLIKTFEHFNDEEFSFTINYDEITGAEPEFAGTGLILKNNNLKVNIDCTSLNIFKYISDDLFKNTISAIESVVTTFSLSNLTIDKIRSLSDLDKDNKYLDIKSENGHVYVCSKTFELLIEEQPKAINCKLSIFKDQFSNIDPENYIVTMGDDRLVFTSNDTDTICVTSRVESED